MEQNNSDPFIPAFSGNPEELDEFVNMILEDMTLEQLAYYAVGQFADNGIVTPSGYKLPPATLSDAKDTVAGVDTDFPMTVTIGQSWDKELAKKIGHVIGVERRAVVEAAVPNTLCFCAVSDLRMIPLAGRLYEAYAEDPYLSGELMDSTANGFMGDHEFYVMTQMLTKHFSTYPCEWDRWDTTNYINARSLREYQFPCFLKGFDRNHLLGVMTSYGCTNGLPNPAASYIRLLAEASKYSPYNVSDYNGDAYLLENLGNGFDKSYAQTGEQVAAMLMLAGSYTDNYEADTVSIQHHINAVNRGLLGVNRKIIEEHIRPQIEIWVRSGYFNLDEYPFADYASDRNPLTSSNPEHQEIALEAAQSGFVLLKNTDNILPLSKDSSILVSGINADYRMQPGYSTPTPEGIPNTGYTPVEGIKAYLQGSNGSITYVPELSSDRIRLRSVLTNNYLVTNEDGSISASASGADTAAVFQLFDWGQDAYSLADSSQTQCLEVDDDSLISMIERDPTTIPSLISYEKAESGQIFMRHGIFFTTILTRFNAPVPFYQQFIKMGNYLAVDQDTTKLVIGAETAAGYSEESLFEEEIVTEAGEEASLYTADNEYAILVIGGSSYVNASEFDDRANMKFGQSQVKMVNKVAEAFPGKTIVVVWSEFPLEMEEIQNNPNVAAILYTSHAGQYDAYALAQTIFGENSPSGRLTHTWLKDISTLPELKDTEDIDPRYTVYMKNADPEQLKLTYLYNNPTDVTYEFGYGLSYTTFTYGNFELEPQVNEGDSLVVTFRVTNSGNIASREVAQVYAAMKESRYGEHVPNKQLVAFEKTNNLLPGESQLLTLVIDPDSLKKWDVTSKDYFVEQGQYTIMVAHSSENIIWEEDTTILGKSVGYIDLLEPQNLWESSYANHGVRGIEVSKKRTSEFNGNYFAVESVEANDYVILPNVVLTNAVMLELSVASTNEASNIEIYADSMEGDPLCSFTFGATEPVTYYLDADQTIEVTELSYVSITENLSMSVDSVDDLYVLFKDGNIRVDSICAK